MTGAAPPNPPIAADAAPRDASPVDAAAEATAARIRDLAPGEPPRIAVVLGSGWGDLTARIEAPRRIAYAELDGFPAATVPGHSGELWLGRIGANPVAVMSGRKHVYESGDVQAMRHPLRTLRALGCRTLVQTNAAGSLRADLAPGTPMLIVDHLNPSQRSPLIGEGGAERFVSLQDAYDPGLRALARRIAARLGIALAEGVYVWTLGPQFETPAEIRMFQRLGGDAVGMSTVPETILARHAGMRVLALSLITNFGAGLSDEALSHAHTLAQAGAASEIVGRLLADVIAAIDIGGPAA